MKKEIKTANGFISVYVDSFNGRIRMDDYAGTLPVVLKSVMTEVSAWVEKLIVKSRPEDVSFFVSQGFEEEAHINGYFSGKDMHFVTKYFSEKRKISLKLNEEDAIIEKILQPSTSEKDSVSPDIQVATTSDCDELAKLYKEVFRLYPTPVHDPSYLRKTMEEGTVYVFVREKKKMMSAASAEIDRQFHNAELTDCASCPEARGKGHMKKLLSRLEDILIDKGVHCYYTIARAESYGMNKVFFQLGYSYGGRLKNNCVIFSGIEDMNVWYKNIK